MSDYMFIMKGDDSQHVSPEEMQQRMQAYMGWMQKMTAQGRLKAGQPLEPRGAWLKGPESVTSDGPFLEPKEIIGGYVIVSAESLEEATELARNCPLLHHCEIYVRPLLDIPGA